MKTLIVSTLLLLAAGCTPDERQAATDAEHLAVDIAAQQLHHEIDARAATRPATQPSK